MKLKTHIAVGGSSAYPPTEAHRQLLQYLLDCGRFDVLIWIVSGERTDKSYSIDSSFREEMTRYLIESLVIPKGVTFKVIYEDVHKRNTPSYTWLKKLQRTYPHCLLTWYTGSDSIMPQEKYGWLSEIEFAWDNGNKLISEFEIFCIMRAGFPLPPLDHNAFKRFKKLTVIEPVTDTCSSTMVRNAIHDKNPWRHLIKNPKIEATIETNHLFE